MTILNEIFALLLLSLDWLQTPDGTNAVFAVICMAALIGLPAQACLGLTLVLHVLLIMI